MNIRQKETFFCFIFSHPITTLSLFTYSVCDEKVKNKKIPIRLKFKGLDLFSHTLLSNII